MKNKQTNKETKKKKKNKKKKPSQKKFDVNTRYPRRARLDFRGVLNDSYIFVFGI